MLTTVNTPIATHNAKSSIYIMPKNKSNLLFIEKSSICTVKKMLHTTDKIKIPAYNGKSVLADAFSSYFSNLPNICIPP